MVQLLQVGSLNLPLSPHMQQATGGKDKSSFTGKERGTFVNGLESELLSQSEYLAFWYASVRVCARYASIRVCARQCLDSIG